MAMNSRWKTDEELIAIVNKYMQDHPNATRNTVILNAAGNHARVRDMDKRGLIKLPKALPKGSGSGWGKYFYIDSRQKMLVR